MIVTRSVRSRLEAERASGNNTSSDMEHVDRADEGATASTSVPTAARPGNPANLTPPTATITPAVQQFLSMAHDNSHLSNASNSTVISPEFSSITARNVRQQLRESATAHSQRQEDDNMARNAFDTMREDFARQMQEMQRNMQQEIARALNQRSTQHLITRSVDIPAISIAAEAPSSRILYHQPPPTASQQNFEYQQSRPIHMAHNTNRCHPANQYSHNRTSHMPEWPQQSSVAPSMQPDFSNTSQRKIDLSKWGIRFDGSARSMSAEDFIFRVDVLRQDYDCSFQDIKRSFHLLLDGQALDWYWNLRKLTQIRTWEDLERAFLLQFRRFESEFQIQKRIMDRRQLPQEMFEDFFNSVIKLRNQQQSPYSENELVEIMKANLKPSLAHLLFSVKITGLRDFCQQAKRAENLISSQKPLHLHRPLIPPRVHGLENEDNETPNEEWELEAITASSRYTCWNCKQVGHSFVDCPSPTRRIFCFKCGRDNVVTPKCPKCQGNLNLNLPRTGETRSTQTSSR